MQRISSHRSLQAHVQQLLRFHREFHRQLAEHRLAEAVDDQDTASSWPMPRLRQ
jgi:hypothetical protein